MLKLSFALFLKICVDSPYYNWVKMLPLPISEENKEEIAAAILTYCISGCIAEVVLVEIQLVRFMGGKS